MDNVTDVFMPDQGPAHRPLAYAGRRRPAAVMEGGQVPDPLLAEHGFSVLVTVTKNGSRHEILFDAGTSPDGVVENMARLDIDPGTFEAIVCSHGHFDHTTGLDGIIRRLGTVHLPVLIHPHFWRRRRVLLPGRDPLEIPSTSRGALLDAGFEVIEEERPSFLFDRSVLITGEVPRTTGYEPGFPPQQAWLGGTWEPDPLVLDDQALIVDIARDQARCAAVCSVRIEGSVDDLRLVWGRLVYCKDSGRSGSAEHGRFTFLGYTFRPRLATSRAGHFLVSFSPAVSGDALTRIRHTIRAWRIHRRRDLTFAEIVTHINTYVAGWAAYYKRFYKSAMYAAFRGLHVYPMRWAMRKYKRLKHSRKKARAWLERMEQRAPGMFAHWRLGVTVSSY